MTRYLIGTILFGAAGLLGACSDAGGPSAPTYSDSVSLVEATAFVGGAFDRTLDVLEVLRGRGPTTTFATPALVEDALDRHQAGAVPVQARAQATAGSTLDWRTPGALAALLSSPGDGCTISARGTDGDVHSFADANENGIPDDLLVKVECATTFTYEAVTYHDHSLDLISVKEAPGLYGYQESATYLATRKDDLGNTLFGFRSDMSRALDLSAALGTTSGEVKLRDWSDIDGVMDETISGQTWEASFVPSTPITAPPGLLPDGLLSLTGRVYRIAPGRNLSFTLATTGPLVFNGGCPSSSQPPLTSGVLMGLLNNNNPNPAGSSFSILFTGCGAYHTDFSGIQ
jgi:hypothetical protein